jgi:hypothetical protein
LIPLLNIYTGVRTEDDDVGGAMTEAIDEVGVVAVGRRFENVENRLV